MVRTVASEDGRRTRHAGRRGELLAAAADHVVEHGLADLSMRPLAAALGVSHVALLRHFESKENLLVELLGELRARDRIRVAAVVGQHRQEGLEDRLVEAWRLLSAPGHLPFWRFFFEAYGMAVSKPDRFAGFLDDMVEEWLELIESLLGDAVSEHHRRAAATFVLATVRGLILDLLSTGDRRRVDEAATLLGRAIADLK